jgi:hypothetical protein
MDVHMTPQDAGMARSFWLILSALLIGVNGYKEKYGEKGPPMQMHIQECSVGCCHEREYATPRVLKDVSERPET